ncbi:MAG: phenylalanine 4-monooxygenase [Phycisphaerales bacterium]|nr:phenylalanine 4-monooxygenase [Phycisphaerales bacterium]
MDIERLFVTQDPGEYGEEQRGVWNALCTRQNEALRGRACSQFYEGLEKIGLDFQSVPLLDDINTRIAPITGWTARAVPGYVDSRYFFQCLRQRIYPTTVGLRSAQSMDYLEEPDIFHDVYGHVALMADKTYGELLRKLGDVINLTISDQDVLELTRLFWFTIEFGLIREAGDVRILGSGLLSSPGEAIHCLSEGVEQRPFQLAEVIAQPFRIDIFQDVLFIAESLEQLLDATGVLIYQIQERNGIRWPRSA